MNILRLLCGLALVCWSEQKDMRDPNKLEDMGSTKLPTPLESCDCRPKVNTRQGLICGIHCPGGPPEICGKSSYEVTTRKYKAFAGIPFAKPPVKQLRFKSPVPGEAWNGYRDGGWMPPLCPQIDFIQQLQGKGKVIGHEDCLHLNVYVPEVTTYATGFPVMVWIHGGAFSWGGIKEYFANKLMGRDIVLVSIQYRLGILGFLSTGDDVAPGNLALKDQELALRWVQDNIAMFGGDPSKVTIFGQSAGGISAHLQMLNPNAKGLFSRVILQSGTALLPQFQEVNHKDSAIKVAKELISMLEGDDACVDISPNCVIYASQCNYNTFVQGRCQKTCNLCPPGNSYNNEKTLKCLQNITEASSSDEIIVCLQDITEASSFVKVINNFKELGLGPDPYSFRFEEDTILPGPPEKLLRERRYNMVDVMMGINQHDAGWVTKILFHLNLTKPDDISRLILQLTEEKAYVAKQMFQYYLNGIRKYEEDDADKLTEMLGDYFFAIPHDYTLGLHSRDSLYGSKVYAYELKRNGDYDRFNLLSPQIGKHYVDHMEDLQYLLTDDINSEDNKELENIMLSLWTNFATHGNPTPDHSLNFTWTPITLESTDHLVLKIEPYMEADTRCQRRKFLSSLNLRMNQALFPTTWKAQD